ncbi:MAG TPA: ABC transporter permease, partial [Polyangia bacterium]|nr:ABC transporter permease [Polyangia bacterium]
MNERADSPLWQLILTRWRGFYREPSTLFWAFVFPILLAIVLGVAFRNKPPEQVFAAVEEGDDAGAVADALTRSGEVKVERLGRKAAEEALRTGRVVIIVAPRVTDGDELTAPRRYLYDPTRPESRLARAVVDEVLQRAAGRVDPVRVVDGKLTAPGSRYIDF